MSTEWASPLCARCSRPSRSGQDLLLYRARATGDVLLKDELDDIARRRRARVHYLLGDQVGPLSPELSHRLVPRLVQRDAYLCGPQGMATAVRRSLKHAGLPDAQLHEEGFDF